MYFTTTTHKKLFFLPIMKILLKRINVISSGLGEKCKKSVASTYEKILKQGLTFTHYSIK